MLAQGKRERNRKRALQEDTCKCRHTNTAGKRKPWPQVSMALSGVNGLLIVRVRLFGTRLFGMRPELA